MVEAADLLHDEAEPFRWTMGVHALDLDRWLLVDDHRDVDLAEAARTLRTRPELTHLLPGARPAALEVATAVEVHLRRARPELGPELDRLDVARAPNPLAAVRQVVQEDLCLLERGVDGWVMTACVVAAPTAWDVASKVGRELDAIHAPVPRYADDLAPRMSAFFDRLRVDRPVWRANRTMADGGELLLETPVRVAEIDPTVTPATVGDRLWLRVEYQTLRRFPETDAVLFTIRVLRQRLSSLAERPDAAVVLRRLVGGLEAIPPDVARYKHSSVMYLPQIRAWAATVLAP